MEKHSVFVHYAVIMKKLQALNSDTKKQILCALNIVPNEDPVVDLVGALEHRIIDREANKRAWLSNGKDMIHFFDVVDCLNDGNDQKLSEILNEIKKYNSRFI